MPSIIATLQFLRWCKGTGRVEVHGGGEVTGRRRACSGRRELCVEPPGRGDEVLEFVTEHEERSTMRTLPGRPMRIRNARGIETDLEREGFVLVRHVSAVADFGAIEEDQTVDQQYIEEMTELLRQVTGAYAGDDAGRGQEALRRDRRRQARPAHQRQAGALPARRQHRRVVGRDDRR